MATESANIILRHIRQWAGQRLDAHALDRELLERFSLRGDATAFEELLRRHGPMVLRVCRRLLPQWADAEDVFQATFLTLARKAASIRRRDAVAAWLHGVAHRLAQQVRIAASRRSFHESRVPNRPVTDPLDEISLRDALALLDEELARLPEHLRAPLVLCYLEGTTRDEAAGRLGWSLATIKRRLERGRQLLHKRLTRRGVTLSATLLAAAVSETTGSAAVPASLASGTMHAALQLAAGHAVTGMVSANVAALVDAATKPLFLSS
ncbi:MAG TPA: RNA polymerase sigma factor [Gemmataceae bacterium]|nr:RNA polymerase sigma factor [Gemmataceae bacterium]